jgi:uncharacterized protein YndB with AHSA1/START domain
MNDRSVIHASFTVDRVFEASPRRVFAACTDPAIKPRWFHHPDASMPPEYSLDFRVGGREFNRVAPPGGPVHTDEARFYDIVPNERIVSAYEMHLDDARISVSLACMEFKPEGSGTRLTITEHRAFLDGSDTPELRERGTSDLLGALDAYLQREPANV